MLNHMTSSTLGDWLRAALLTAAMAFGAPVLAADCDVNGDGAINLTDINLVVQARNTPAGPNDARDANHDGTINAADARVCTTRCSLPRCAAGPVYTALQLALPQPVVGADSSFNLQPTVLDGSGKAVATLPSINYQVAPASNAANATSGDLPTVLGNTIQVPANTRGSFVVTGTVANTAITAQAQFTVLQDTSGSSTAELFVKQSAAQANVNNGLAGLAKAVQNGDLAGIANAHATLMNAANTVDPSALSLTTVYAPDTGFVPTASQLASRGYPQTAGDVQFGNLTAQVRAKIQQITQLLNQPSGNDANDTNTLGQYVNELQTLLNQLQQAANRPSPYGLSNKASDVNNLMTTDLPKILKALAGRVDTQLKQAGLIAQAGGPGHMYAQREPSAPAAASATPAAMYASTQPVFLLTGLLGYAGNIGGLIQRIYGDYLDQVQKMYLLLAAQNLLNDFLGQTVGEIGLVTGASLSFHVYHQPNSVIDISGMSSADAQNVDVFLIGGAAVNAVDGLISQLGSVSQISSIQELNDFFQGMLDAIEAAGQAYEDAHQQPDWYEYSDFCIGLLGDSCMEFVYGSGFDYVGSGGPVNIEPVIVLVRVNSPLGSKFGSGIFNFVGK